MRFAICTSIYETARPFFDDWISSVISASFGHETQAIISLDGLYENDKGLRNLIDSMPVEFITAPADANIAQVRSAMLHQAIQADADILVFCDIDDYLDKNALSLHAIALEKADFSYGNMQPISRDGSSLGPTFFDGSAVPVSINRTESIIDRNWLGFSNTAVWRPRLPTTVCIVPKTIIAVDWWFFTTLLKKGLTGKLAEGVVSNYRIYEGNQLGYRPKATIEAVKKRLRISKRHYEAFPSDIIAKQRLSRINHLITKVSENPNSMQGPIEGACTSTKLWYEDIAKLMEETSTANITAIQMPAYSEPGQLTTHDQLVSGLVENGVESGDILMVHISVKSLGFIVGGLRTILNALYDALGDGTLMMPAFTGDLTDPSTWFKPPIAEQHWQAIRDSLPAFDPKRTPTQGVGALAELFRNEPKTKRSNHPVSSFAARGPHANKLLKLHNIGSRLGKESPLQTLCDLGGKVLMIGAPYESMTLLHLSSDRIDNGMYVDQRSPMLIDGQKKWISYQDRSLSWQWFSAAVEHLIEKDVARTGMIRGARTIIADAALSIDATCLWRKKNNC